MSLGIETFSNARGGNVAYKALTHPLAGERAAALLADLAAAGPVAVYDPHGLAGPFAALYDMRRVQVAGVYCQKIEDIGREVLGRPARPVTELPGCGAGTLFVAAFDADRPAGHVRHLVSEATRILTLDAIRLPPELVTRPERYLDPVNFAVNLAFFRDADGLHTRLRGANYWAGYGADAVRLWLRLFGETGQPLASWEEALPATPGGLVVDSREVRRRFGLGPFVGQLFLHAVGARGHDVVKYALDTWNEGDAALSCTHDANAWPADLYAGLPAPAEGEQVVLWIQNSHPVPIPAGAVGLARLGSERVVHFRAEIPPFASRAVDVGSLVPDARWPDQLELHAGRHVVRPRYEVRGATGRRRIAHVNVERTDLAPDAALAGLGSLLGKGHILPAPVLPPERWRTELLPTPMSTAQRDLPLAAVVYDADGRQRARRFLGRLDRAAVPAFDLSEILGAAPLGTAWGHVELIYDFREGGAADGWLHAIFRYTDRATAHAAETSFGSHVFNTALVYRGEPQSYGGPPPGLSTRLFLRLGDAGRDTFCHLIYPASTPWHARSQTALVLHDGAGAEIARRAAAIPCSGSLLWRASQMFDAHELRRAGDAGYVLVRDATCRLFGYHGLLGDGGAFSLDHMFGF